MSTWHSKSLGDSIAASIDTPGIEERFQALFEAAGKPVEMAIFTLLEQGPMHCEVTAYFSPAAAEVARGVGAQPCEPPASQGLTLLAGKTECWPVLFH